MSRRLSKRAIAPLVALATAASSGSLSAAIYYSGDLGPGGTGIAIPTSFNGIYIDFETEGFTEPSNDPDAPDPGGYTVGYSEPPTSWDINLFFGGIGIAYSPTAQPFVDDVVSNTSQILDVSFGVEISTAASTRTLGLNVSEGTYGGSGRPNGSSGSSHFDTPIVDSDPNYSAFSSGQQGYIAFVLDPGAGETYGWMSVTLNNDGTAGSIHSFAFSDETNFQVGQVPEPSIALLLGLASLMTFRRRRSHD